MNAMRAFDCIAYETSGSCASQLHDRFLRNSFSHLSRDIFRNYSLEKSQRFTAVTFQGSSG